MSCICCIFYTLKGFLWEYSSLPVSVWSHKHRANIFTSSLTCLLKVRSNSIITYYFTVLSKYALSYYPRLYKETQNNQHSYVRFQFSFVSGTEQRWLLRSLFVQFGFSLSWHANSAHLKPPLVTLLLFTVTCLCKSWLGNQSPWHYVGYIWPRDAVDHFIYCLGFCAVTVSSVLVMSCCALEKPLPNYFPISTVNVLVKCNY